ncbi:MAG: galactose mutarotase [Ruminococcaceae bacterium]|nr:galactose mutarotase [Oscillospiraceae bacterium]
MEKKLFGTLPTGEEIYIYTLRTEDALVNIMTRGATIVNFKAFGTDIVGGFDKLETYLAETSHQGAIIGRVANRVGGARFEMDGKVYTLPDNDKGNCLHGGDGFDHKVWTVTDYSDTSITLEYTSKDGEEGFPSQLRVVVTYKLSGANLLIDYLAYPEGKTPIALTNHAYFNLDGFGGTIEEHTAVIYADRYTEVDDLLIPNGNRPAVEGTPFDFKTPHTIGERCGKDFIGYDHNFILSPEKKEVLFGKELGLIADVKGKKLGMKVYTDQPGVQFYIGNFLGNGPDFRGGTKQVFHGAFCLETQTEPDCINHGIGFYNKGDVYTHSTVYAVEEL